MVKNPSDFKQQNRGKKSRRLSGRKNPPHSRFAVPPILNPTPSNEATSRSPE